MELDKMFSGLVGASVAIFLFSIRERLDSRNRARELRREELKKRYAEASYFYQFVAEIEQKFRRQKQSDYGRVETPEQREAFVEKLDKQLSTTHDPAHREINESLVALLHDQSDENAHTTVSLYKKAIHDYEMDNAVFNKKYNYHSVGGLPGTSQQKLGAEPVPYPVDTKTWLKKLVGVIDRAQLSIVALTGALIALNAASKLFGESFPVLKSLVLQGVIAVFVVTALNFGSSFLARYLYKRIFEKRSS